MFDIKNFTSEINKRGLAKTSHFSMNCFSPVGMADISRSMSMRITTTDLPGRAAQVVEHSHYGPVSHIAVNSTMTEININVLLSEYQEEREYFEAWMDLMVGDYRIGSHENPYDVAFYDDYKGSFEIINYNELGDITRVTKLVDAFPTTIGNVAMDWSNGNEFMILPVTLTYKKYLNT